MTKTIINIGQLVQVREQEQPILRGAMMADVPTLENAWMRIENGIIQDFGSMEEYRKDDSIEVDVAGRMVCPTFVDSHTHLVYAEDRDEEFVMKVKGMDYQAIAEAGGGILNSAKKLQNCSEDQLYDRAAQRLKETIKSGTGAIEIKSGYGLSLESELKMLQVIQRLKNNFNIPIKATFLGAHAFPHNDHDKYIQSITQEMLPEIYSQQLADYIDCFCEEGYYSVDQMSKVLEAGEKYDLKPKVHVNQFNSIGGIEKAIEFGALTVDHLEVLSEEEIALLKDSDTIPVALPGCSFFINIPYTPARMIIDNGLPLVIASDFNPGSAPSSSLSFANSLATIQMDLVPEEAFNATTLNAAFALELSSEVGSITIGKKANFIVAKKDKKLNSIAYNFGMDWIEEVYIDGEKY